MKIAIITSAPNMIENCIESTILRKAVESKNIEIYMNNSNNKVNIISK